MNTQPIHILNKIFGYDQFRPKQQAIINAVINNNDVLALLPTGGGKSICYQIPGILLNGICIVISPLVALIKDQVDNLKRKGIKAVGITGGIKYQELDDILDNCIYGQYQFLYLSPERLQQDLVIQRIARMNVSLIAVDEAHCISQWGHDFRPAYREISHIRELHKQTPIIAVTATATIDVQQDIINSLNLTNVQQFKNSYARDNITYSIIDTQDKNAAIFDFYNHHPGSSIIYVRSRKNTLKYAQLLNSNQITAGYYHGGLPNKIKEKTAASWMTNTLQVMVATNAFGMGIDKADVRSIIHIQMPESIESYYQETGRAGRDGNPSKAQFYYNLNDITNARRQFLASQPTLSNVKLIYRKLNQYFNIALGEGQHSMHQLNFVQFIKQYDLPALLCYNVLQALDRFSIINFTQTQHKRSSIRFRESGKKIMQFLNQHPIMNAIIQSILRTYGSSNYQDIDINTALIAIKSNTTEQQVLKTLRTLADQAMIDATIIESDCQIVFLVPRDDDRTINKFAQDIEQQNQVKSDKLNRLCELITCNDKCINVRILSYFGEKSNACGTCSVCKQPSKITDLALSLKNVLPNKDLSFKEIASLYPNHDLSQLNQCLRELLDQGKIKIKSNNKITWRG